MRQKVKWWLAETNTSLPNGQSHMVFLNFRNNADKWTELRPKSGLTAKISFSSFKFKAAKLAEIAFFKKGVWLPQIETKSKKTQ